MKNSVARDRNERSMKLLLEFGGEKARRQLVTGNV